MRVKLWYQLEQLFWGDHVNILHASLVRLDTSKLCTEKVNTWKWDGNARFNIFKDGDTKYSEVYLFLLRKKGVIAQRIQRFPQQMGPVKDNPTIV